MGISSFSKTVYDAPAHHAVHRGRIAPPRYYIAYLLRGHVMTPFQEVVRLKIERRKAESKRQGEIDARVRMVEPQLSHEEAVFIVKKYETE